MAKQVKYFTQIIPHLEKKYGAVKTQAIMEAALARYDELVAENADEPKEHYMHTRERIYPGIAAFDAMLAAGIERQEAADFLVDYYKWRASGVAPKIKVLMKIPGLYKAIPKFFFNMTQKSFGPQMGFTSENGYVDKKEMRFDMTRCPYFEKCSHYGCPEIVVGYCDADDICYGSMHPKLVWGRTKTIDHGGDCCDFRIRIAD